MVKGEPEFRFLPIGHITAAHGIRGEVKVALLTDYPERFRPGARVFLGGEIDAQPVEIAAARPHKQAMLVKLVGVPDRNAAERMVGQLVLIPNEDRMPLAEGENYAYELLGLRVESTAGRALGEITDILSTGANDVYVVTAPDREILIPALREVVLAVDLTEGKMVVELPEGLVD